jgi:hypothetical protein
MIVTCLLIALLLAGVLALPHVAYPPKRRDEEDDCE